MFYDEKRNLVSRAGKTTLLKIILGFLQPTTGNVRIWGGADGDSHSNFVLPYFAGARTTF